MLIEKGKFSKRTAILLGILVVIFIAGGYMVYDSFFAGPGAPPAATGLIEPGTGSVSSPKPLTYTVEDTIFSNPQFYTMEKDPFEGFTDQYTGIALDATKPMPPEKVAIDNQKTGKKLNISWRIPEYVNFNLVRIYRIAPGESEPTLIHEAKIVEAAAGTRGTYQDTDLENDEAYYYLVRTAYKDNGNEWESANAVPIVGIPTDEIAPDPPLNVTVRSSGENGIVISWIEPNDSDFAFARIYRSTVEGSLGELIYPQGFDEWEEDETQFIDPVASNIPYYYTVTSVDWAGNESSKDILAAPARSNPFEPVI